MEKKKQQDFLALYEPAHERFVRYCTARAHGVMEVEDLVSESVLVALENFGKIKEKDAFLYYLFGVARKIVGNKLRRKKFMGIFDSSSAEEMKQEGGNPEMQADVRHLYEALNQLPDQQREALILFEISGFSLKEIQEIQKSGLSAVKARISRGRVKLADLLGVEEIGKEGVNNRSSVILSLFL
jgi:RNA polymerase sigma-70 factor (ECF subfamily)